MSYHAEVALVDELRARADMIESLDRAAGGFRPRNVTIMREAADVIERLTRARMTADESAKSAQ